MWRKDYPYLKDSSFIDLIDTQHVKKEYIKITLLDWKEDPIREIQGLSTGGTININGSSSVRRTCTLSMIVQDIKDAAIGDVQNLLSIGKKVFLEIGITNQTSKYREKYPIVWFPQGYFVFTQCSITSGINSNITISAQLKDKMCLLNGECGGVLPATVRFDAWDTIGEDGEWITEKVTIAQIIKEAVNHWGGEQLGKILISDINEKEKMVMCWTNDLPLYEDTANHIFTMNKDDISGQPIREYKYGEDVGFIYTKFIYPDELIAKPGDNLCTAVLDKIKNMLGNYEYFYDVYGNFIFQEIKDYKNTTQAKVEIDKIKKGDYQIDISKGKSVYDFKSNELVMSFSNTPQYNRIKNDFVIWGTRTGPEDFKYPIRYHLAIDRKPQTGKIYNIFLYTDNEDGLTKIAIPNEYNSIDDFPRPGTIDNYYYDISTKCLYIWDTKLEDYVFVTGYRVQEYPTYNDFPQYPDPLLQENYVYLDLSTNKTYSYTIVKNDHYYDVEEEILTAKENHDIAIQNYNTEINNYKRYIKEKQDLLKKLDNQYKDLLNQLATYREVYNSAEKQKISYRAKQSSNTNKINSLTSYNITLRQKKVSLEQQASQYPVGSPEYNELIRQAQAIGAQCTRNEYEISKLERENDILNTKITQADSNRTSAASKINSINNQLASYYTQAEILNNQINEYQAAIDRLNNDIITENENYQNENEELKRKQKSYKEVNEKSLIKMKVTDWRTQLYIEGVIAEKLGLQLNYYYAELKAEWPKLYDFAANSYIDNNGNTIYTGDFKQEVKDNPWDLDYWLDFIDSEAAIGGLSVYNIGRRTLSEDKQDYNCLFEQEVPDIILINNGDPEASEEIAECIRRDQKYTEIDSFIFKYFAIGGMKNSCFERIKEALYDYTAYNNSVSVTCIPIYHLEPNTRITLSSQQNDISGDHLINSLSIPLTISGNMTISAIKCNARL